MGLRIHTVREQLDNQRLPLGEEFQTHLGTEWRFKPNTSDVTKVALFARIIKDENTGVTLVCDTSYFIGMVWLVPGRLAVHVEPKMNLPEGRIEVDYLAMLEEALDEPENLKHLSGIQYCYTKEPCIPLKHEDTGIRLFLIAQFLAFVGRIRRRGLKRSFYDREERFVYGMKGRILLSKSLRSARTPALIDHLSCSVQHFDVDTPANQYLKKALRETLLLLQSPVFNNELQLTELARLGLKAFEAVSDVVDPSPVRIRRVNPVYRDYAEALRLAELILSSSTLGHEATAGCTEIPPYWIDMSKLFELFVYRKLRRALCCEGRVEFQFGAKRQYLDYLCKAPNSSIPFFIADAKYKPRYSDSSIHKDDLRQLAGYARLAEVETTLRQDSWGWDSSSRLIPCVIIYPTLNKGAEEIDLTNGPKPIPGWTEFSKVEVTIPIKIL